MATNATTICASPETVFRLLATGHCYAEWVVGAKRIRSVDPHWPQPGSEFHHTVGVGPLKLNDRTRVVAVDPPRRLVLDACARPLGRATVALHLEEVASGTRVTMREELGLAPGAVKRAADRMIQLRNARGLRRLGKLCEPQSDPAGRIGAPSVRRAASVAARAVARMRPR